MKILFAATPKIALKTLKEIHSSSHEVVFVLTSEEKPSGRGLKIRKSPISEFAISEGIEIRNQHSLSEVDFVKEIKNLGIDLIVVFAFGFILSEKVISAPKFGSINIHTSLLPKYRGAAPIQRSIMAGDKKTGITFMKMDAGMDTGPLISRIQVDINEGETSEEISEKLSDISSSNIIQTIDSIEFNKYTLVPQNEEESSYAPKITKEESFIDWNQPARKIADKINALCPNPCAHAKYKNERIIFYKAVVSDYASNSPGKIERFDKNEFLVGAQDSCISVLELARQNKKRMSFKDFYNGSKDFFNDNEEFHN